MIVDMTGIILTPGNIGENCYGNGEHKYKHGKSIERCCDECDYYLECFPDWKKDLSENI